MTSSHLDAAIKGDRLAFEELLRPLIDPAYGMAMAMLGQREAAEDAVQEGAFKAWRAVRRLRPDTTDLKPWFFAIVANECRSQRRRPWWRVLRFGSLPEEAEGAKDPDLAGHSDLQQAIGRLSPADRQVLYLFFELDLPFPEMGTALGISASAAKARLYRITRRLRPELETWEAWT